MEAYYAKSRRLRRFRHREISDQIEAILRSGLALLRPPKTQPLGQGDVRRFLGSSLKAGDWGCQRCIAAQVWQVIPPNLPRERAFLRIAFLLGHFSNDDGGFSDSQYPLPVSPILPERRSASLV